MPNYLDESYRKQILQELNSEENKRRKEESLMSLEVVKGRQSQFILNKIQKELGIEAAKKSRTITSINLTKKLIKEQSQLYKNEPERTFTNTNDKQHEHIEKLYDYAKADLKLKKSNEIFKLQDQGCLMVVLSEGKVQLRPLYAHHYDVIPVAENPEKAECYIISSFDKSLVFNQSSNTQSGPFSYLDKGIFSDNTNQKIGDTDDYKGVNRFFWWTAEYNFTTNSKGQIIDENNIILKQVTDDDIKNPIGRLPFIDIAADKDFEFYVRSGYNAVNFTIDLGLLLSDVAEISRLQGFSQAIITSVDEPMDLQVGPRKVLWLKILPNADAGTRPDFKFASPSPDLGNSLQLVSNYLSMFLTSQGQSPKLVNATGQAETFTSGVDRFLSMLEKFEMSAEDINMYGCVEDELFELFKAWNNAYYSATTNGFIPELAGVYIPDDSEVSVKFHKPSMMLSEVDKLDVIERRRDLGLMSQVEAIQFDREIDEAEAIKVNDKIKSEDEFLLTDKPNPIVTSVMNDSNEANLDIGEVDGQA